jgi:flagellar protein FliO/FliZ
MTVNASIPVRREPDVGHSAAGSELAWVGALILVVVLVLSFWARLRKTRTGRNDSQGAPPAVNWLSRLQGRSASTPLVVVSTRLTPTHSLHDVQWQGRRLLIGCCDQSIQVLSEAPTVGTSGEVSGMSGDTEKATR